MNIIEKIHEDRYSTDLYRTLIMVLVIIFFYNSTNISFVPKLAAQSSNVPWPKADGTFIQSYLVNGWSDEKWQSELGYLKEAGMNYIILQSTADRANGGVLKTIYPTGNPDFQMYRGYSDVVDECLRNAEIMGFKVFLGLNFDSDWWNWHSRNPEWVYDRMREGNMVAAELYDMYHSKYPNAFYGWYWPWEVDNLTFDTRIQQQVLSNAININLKFLDNTKRRLPFMLSPFMNRQLGNANKYRDLWVNIFNNTDLKEGDIFCPQDSVGAGGLDIEMLSEWFYALRQAVDVKPGLLLWSDVEIFDQKDWTSTTVDRFTRQMKIVQPYVDNIVTFAYSHYYSPNVTNQGFHKAYMYYAENGYLKSDSPISPSNIKKKRLKNGDISLTWRAPSDTSNICGYLIYRDGALIKKLQVPRSGTENVFKPSFTDNTKGRSLSSKYDVKSYDFFGNISETVNEQ